VYTTIVYQHIAAFMGKQCMKISFLMLFAIIQCFTALCWANDDTIETLYKNHQSDVQVFGRGSVVKILRDDVKGSRHQKFILRLDSGHTLLVAHNIDLAPRLDSLAELDVVEFYGEYEWNLKGGIIHWTHHDPNNKHVAGWLRHKGRKYD